MDCRLGFSLFLVLFTVIVSSFFLLLVTLSAPLESKLYFLRASQAGGVRFGTWGWCLEEDQICLSPMRLGYTWEPEIAVPITGTLLFYPIGSIATLLALIAFIPVMFARNARTDGVFAFFIFLSFITSFIAFIFMMAMFGVAKSRFQAAGYSANYGSLPWLSLTASLILFFVSVGWFVGTRIQRPRDWVLDNESLPPTSSTVRPKV